MGVKLGVLRGRGITLESLKNKKIAVDAYVFLYQFLKTMPELTDSKGRITTHLVGLFNRTIHLMRFGAKLCYVFDGPSPSVGKHKRFIREESHPRITTTITEDIVNSSKELLSALGIPVIQAPAEGEAQCAFMAQQDDVWAVGSKDFDSLVFGAPRMLENLTIAKRRKLPKGGFVWIGPVLYELSKVLRQLKIDHDQLIILAILSGTDFAPGGARNVGPKKALELLQKYKHDYDKIFRIVDWPFYFSWKDVYDLITTMPVTDKYKLQWSPPDKERVKRLLVDEYDFEEKRVDSALAKIMLRKARKKKR